jgi:uncharacterized protein YraI
MKLGLKRILAGGVTVLLVSLACSINVDLGQSSHTNLPTDTVVARTLEALTQPAVGTTTSLATEVTFTSTAVVGTSTPVSTSTPQPTTVTSEALCYAGPGDAYEVVSSIKPGTQVKLLGRGALSGWLVLANPIYTDPCWIMSQYVSMDPSIDTSTLIVYAVPPTPTPDLGFQLQYQFLNICSGWDPVFSVRNTGGKTFRSYDAVVVDSNATTQYERKANDFGKPSGCSLSSSIPQLGANQSGWVHAFGFGYSIVNKKLEATVTLCTGTAQNGDCTTQSLPFSPP